MSDFEKKDKISDSKKKGIEEVISGVEKNHAEKETHAGGKAHAGHDPSHDHEEIFEEHTHHSHEHKHSCHSHEGHSHDGLECCCHNHDEGEEGGKGKIILSLVLFAIALVLEHVSFFAQSLGQIKFDSTDLNSVLCLVFYFISYIICGKDVIKSALKNIQKGQIFDEQFLMTVASVGAIFVGEIGEAVAIMLFYNIGEFFQDYAVDKSRNSISALMDIRPDKAFVLRNDFVQEVHPQDVKVGELIQVKPGERVALDGIVQSGSSYMDTSALTGESVPRKVGEGSEILSGFVNQQGVVQIRVTKPYSQSTVTRILELTQNASSVKAKSEKFITRFAKVYTPIVCFTALAVALIPPCAIYFFGSQEFTSELWRTWIYRALMFLVVSCPCALVISVPLSFFSGIGSASKNGILVKGSNFVEALSKVDTAVFDKTGTLTKGIFAVTEVFAENDMNEDDLIAIAAHAEYFSNHPISKSLKNSHFERNATRGQDNQCCQNCKKDSVEELNGMGIKINIDGKKVLAGNEKLLAQEKIEIPKQVKEKLLKLNHGGTIVYVAQENSYKGSIVISDEVKEDSFDTIKKLKKLGVKKNVMLTGDNAETAAIIASDLGIDTVFSSLLPEDKVSRVEDLIESKNERGTKSKGTVMFMGDGVNDSPVLACADVGIAMGALGSDAAIEAADVVIMDDKPSRLIQAIKISRRTMSVVRQNIIFSLGVKTAIMIFGALGIVNMWFAVFGDVGVTFLAVLNSMRVLKK